MKKIIFSMGIFIVLILISNISNATTISVTPAEPVVGDEITITITVPNVHTTSVTANISGILSGQIKVVGGDLAGEAKDYSKSAKFTCSASGTLKIEISSDSSAVLNGQYVDVSASKTITVKEVVTPPQQDPPTPTTPTTPTTPPVVNKSSEARLSNFGIFPNDFRGFRKDIYEYTTEVPNDVEEVEIYAEKVDNKATVEGIGKVSLKEGSNKFEVKVTAEDGKTTKTYKLTINRKTTAQANVEQSEARLSDLGIKPEKYDFEGFNKDKTEYSVRIPEDVNEIEVYAKAVNANAQIMGTGIITLEEGESTLEIVVISENGNKKTYSINVIRTEAEKTEEPVEEKLGLEKLTITGLTLNPKFSEETYEYELDLTEDINQLEILAKANDENATIEIIGNENLKNGENVITILVKAKDSEEVTTYQIIVNKNVIIEEIAMSWLKPSTWGKEEIIKIVIVVVLIILIITAILLKISISKESRIAREVELPGAEELDKAIAEHQGLTGEETSEEEFVVATTINTEKEEAKANYLEEIARSRENEIEQSMIYEEEIEIKRKRKGKHF